MKTPHEIHWKAAKRILHYVHGTIHFGIHYSSGGTPLLVGFTNSDWVSDLDDRKSTAGYVFSLVLAIFLVKRDRMQKKGLKTHLS